jgi:hypothetical protein
VCRVKTERAKLIASKHSKPQAKPQSSLKPALKQPKPAKVSKLPALEKELTLSGVSKKPLPSVGSSSSGSGLGATGGGGGGVIAKLAAATTAPQPLPANFSTLSASDSAEQLEELQSQVVVRPLPRIRGHEQA